MTFRLLLTPPAEQLTALTARLLPLLPDWRREQALRYRMPLGQWQCAQAYVLLTDLLHEAYGVSALRSAGIIDPVSFQYLPHGKPVLSQRTCPEQSRRIGPEQSRRNVPFFSISHCAEAVLCMVDDRGPVGCDVESFTVPDEPLLRLTCNEAESLSITTDAQPSAAFARLWTQKEAVLKCLGDGLTDNLPDVFPDRLPAGYQLVTTTDTVHAFAYTLCCKGQ